MTDYAQKEAEVNAGGLDPKCVPFNKRLAYGLSLEGDGNFGCESLKSVQGNDTRDAMLKDSERGAGPPIEGNQANPTHGFPK